MYKIRTLNNISVAGLERFPRADYEVASEIAHPHAIMVRSADMHTLELPDSLLAIGRAGAGVNNIPVDLCNERGVAVFNAPGANANAVKELVLGSMFAASRNLFDAWSYVRSLTGDGEALAQAVEAGKKQYVGTELPGRTLGVLGLGAIGVKVANAAHVLGMDVMGFDPAMTVDRAWQLESAVQAARNVDEVLCNSDFITLHVPLVDATRELINARRIAGMRKGAILMNFSRAGIVRNDDVIAALNSGQLRAYVSDFPSPELIAHPRAVTLPHLGASTHEAQDNCASMVADQLKDYLQHGNVVNAVNLPDATMPRVGGTRIAAVHSNVPNMLGQISTTLAGARLNIIDMLNRSRGALAYTLLDVEGDVAPGVLDELGAIEGIKLARSFD
jgi:D-3-phosphoglycerate dehydrogenase / 2-oxoglutarate reductase